MPVQTTYPGVYIQELPSGTHTIVGVATSITGFIGYLRRGPINTAVPLLNFGDFQRVYGGIDSLSDTSYQISQFFLNGGTECWVTRCVDATQPPVLPVAPVPGGPIGGTGKPGTTPTPPTGVATLSASAANPGTWGENLYLTIDYMTPSGSNAFNLYATLYNFASGGASVVRTTGLTGVTMDMTQPNYIGEALLSLSSTYTNLINIADLVNPATAGPGYVPPAAPLPSGTILQFVPPAQAAAGVTLTVSVVLPTPPGQKTPPTPPAPVTVAVGSILTFQDFVAAVQSALAVAGAQMNIPALASAAVRTFALPFVTTPPASATPNMVQILLTDPLQAGVLVSVVGSSKSLFNQLQTNIHAINLAAPPPPSASPPPAGGSAPPPPPPDGALPKGIDIAGNSTNRTGVYAFDGVSIINLLSAPDLRYMTTSDYLTSATSILNYVLQRRAFAILDLPSTVNSVPLASAWVSTIPPSFGPGIISAAAYYPEPEVPDPFSSQPRSIGASGTMAGLYAQTDLTRGVWKAPAGITAALTGVQELAYVMTDQENGILNPQGMNALRTFPVYGSIAWGARTLASANPADDDWKYINVRRLALYMEQSLVAGLQWVVFEPNDATLWAQIRLTVTSFLHPLFQQGAFVGSTPDQAYQVICDASTTTPEDMDNGIVNILILFAPVKPAEFVVISIQQMAGQSSS
uniref:Tail sheath protein n=1 Tax=Caulobacter sp. (strain K31) TaxID=366602 RepID=B0T4K1_CAUSK